MHTCLVDCHWPRHLYKHSIFLSVLYLAKVGQIELLKAYFAILEVYDWPRALPQYVSVHIIDIFEHDTRGGRFVWSPAN